MIGTSLDTFDSQKIEIQVNKQLKPMTPENELVFGKDFTDHMVSIEWDIENGWSAPQIKPYGKLELEPSAVVFHYGFEVIINSMQLYYVVCA